MTITVIGTPNSGKSELAENKVCEIAGSDEKYYIATMIPYGSEGEKRVQKHRSQREGKGFVTIEQPMDVDKALEKISCPEDAAVLLECAANLAANEMFERKCYNPAPVAEKIIRDIISIRNVVRNLVIVSNRFEEEPGFDEETRNYAALMTELDRRFEEISDEIIRL